jgi:hypothetical protein
VIKTIAVLYELVLTISDFADLSLSSCLMGAPQPAERLKQHPAERLAAWRCVIADRMAGSLGWRFVANPIGAVLSCELV